MPSPARARLAAFITVLLVLCIAPAPSFATRLSKHALSQEQPEYSCDDINAVPAAQRCAFVKEHCESDSRIDYTRWYHCSAAPHGWWAKGMFVLMLLVLLPLLFTALGDTAELYFSPTMALIAQTIPGMRPRFAGVTFVAVGNGAPDLSANISALRTGQVALSAGAFTGAAMFVQCVVASEVIRIAGGVKCRGATLRDVGVYAASVAGVCLALHSGKVTHWFVAGTSLTYLAYATWVFLGDEWHARGRPDLSPGLRMSWTDLRALLLRRQHLQLQRHRQPQGQPMHAPVAVTSGYAAESDTLNQALLPWASADEAAEVAAPAPAGTATGPATVSRRSSQQQAPSFTAELQPARSGSGLLGSHAYRQAVWADLGWEPTARGQKQLVVELRGGGGGGAGPPETPQSGAGFAPSSEDGSYQAATPWDMQGPPQRQEEPAQEQQRLLGEGRQGVAQGGGEGLQGGTLWQHPAWRAVCHELTLGSCEEWGALPPWRQTIRRTTYTLLLPLYVALRLSIPQVDPETYNQQWLVVSLLCSPLAVLVYFGAFSLGAVVTAMVGGACIAAAMHVLTKDEPEMPRLDCGTRFALGPALVSLAGFFVGVLWIDSLASEVVGIATVLSGLLSLPPSLVGLTLLAWGNSLGDFFSNQAMARRGASSTALTACFAAPLFYMLLSMSLGFSAYFAKEHTSSAPTSLPSDAALGCTALVCYNIILAAVGILNKNYLPARFYMFARCWYGLYLIAAATLALTGKG